MKVGSAFESLIYHSDTLNETERAKDEKIAYFVTEYFEKNYIGKKQEDGKRKDPRFPIELWSVYESTMNGELNFILFI